MITYYDRPIKKMQHNGMPVEYCVWNDGLRLISVNGFPHYRLNNCIFSHYMDLITQHEGMNK